MNRRELLCAIAAGCFTTFTSRCSWAAALPATAASADNTPLTAPHAALEWLRFGECKPTGWIRNQMVRDLRQGFAGALGKLCHEASSDIFVGNRNTLHAENTKNAADINWWNGETEGNWRAGHIMMAFLSGDEDAIAEARRYVHHILQSQDADGYIGIFAPELRFSRQGELWTQACLFRGLLAYYELTGEADVLTAVRRAADLMIQAYGPGKHTLPRGESHDLMFIDVLERLYDLTGDASYRDFALWFYDDWCRAESKWDATLPSLLDPNKPFMDHGANTYENLRVPLWLATVSDRPEFRQAVHNAFVKVARYVEVSGSVVSEEWIKNVPPDPSLSEYEYCSTKEMQSTFESALQKSGQAAYGDSIELMWFNAAQGSRLPDGSAISYLASDNRLRCNLQSDPGSEGGKRNKYSPTHQDVAVCCNPNATQIAAQYVRNMWMRGPEGLAATLYGPCTLSTKVNGVAIEIEERTSYPFENVVELAIHPERESSFSIDLRDPAWSKATQVHCAGAKIEKLDGYWRLTRSWRPGDHVRIEFAPELRTVTACNSELALQYGALIFAQPLESRKIVLHRYDVGGFEDTAYELAKQAVPLGGLPAATHGSGFGMKVHRVDAHNADYPFDSPQIELRGHLVTASPEKKSVPVTLVPLGNAPLLRRVTFPLIG